MEKVSFQMDLDDWEILPDEHFVGREKKGKFHKERGGSFDPKGVVRPFPSSHLIDSATSEKSSGMNPVPVDLNLVVNKKSQELELELNDIAPPVDKYIDLRSGEADKETVSRVSFKKMKDSEFVDMKMDSPRSPTKGVVHIAEARLVKYDDKEGEHTTHSEVLNDDDDEMTKKSAKKETNWGDDININICGWKLSGVGALCAVGAAAAAVATATTICIVIFGNQKGNKHHHNQKIQLQANSDEKKTKQGVQPEHILKQVVSAATDTPFDGVQMLFGHH